jgi:hypothetical protein
MLKPHHSSNNKKMCALERQIDDRAGNTKNDTFVQNFATVPCDVITDILMMIQVFWDLTPQKETSQKRVTCLLLLDPEDRGIIVLQNTGKYLPVNMAQHLRRCNASDLCFSPCSVRAVLFVMSQHSGQLQGW